MTSKSANYSYVCSLSPIRTDDSFIQADMKKFAFNPGVEKFFAEIMKDLDNPKDLIRFASGFMVYKGWTSSFLHVIYAHVSDQDAGEAINILKELYLKGDCYHSICRTQEENRSVTDYLRFCY
jgi:hypothetical protein